MSDDPLSGPGDLQAVSPPRLPEDHIACLREALERHERNWRTRRAGFALTPVGQIVLSAAQDHVEQVNAAFETTTVGV